MAYQCPRCSGVVRRGSNRAATMVGGLAGGLIGGVGTALFSYVLGTMQCERCGPIPKKEFPPETRTEIRLGSLAIFSTLVMTFVGAIYLLSHWHR